MTHRYICIHGHFYQPPRENAWLERIEIQDSAAPYHDWNERITAECYGPNAASRILNEEKKIVDIVNNYEKLSFNVGPTLLSWLELNNPEIYKAILDADALSVKTQNGHGNAIAQVYNHLIMPLASRRDKETQIKWGIADFKHRYGRSPEGMWLAETAVDKETLELMAANGIQFTIVAPRQVKQWRALYESVWHNSSCDTRKAYRCHLSGDTFIDVFVYDGDISQKMAFENLLENGKDLAKALLNKFSTGDTPQLVHVALDGETFGHHHKHGDMALAYCLHYIEENNLAEIVNYGRYLELFPPEYEIELFDNSSWSCVHGIGRWRSNCGCHTGGEPGWNQLWRAPLREALDYLHNRFDVVYENEISTYAGDIWEMRNDYIAVILDRSDTSLEQFISKHTTRPLNDIERTRFLRLLEMQRHSMLMYTSCGWFFNDISGIETQQVLQYACRGIQLGEQMGHYPMTDQFLEILKRGESNIASFGDGAHIYREHIQISLLSLSRIGLHYAVHALFEDTSDEFVVLNYNAESHNYERFEEGENKLSVGKTTVHSRITHSAKQFCFALLYFGQHHIIGSYSEKLDDEDYIKMRDEVKQNFEESNLAMVMQTIEKYFGSERFSFWQLFKDEQLRVLNAIIRRNRTQTEDNNMENFNNNYPILNVLKRHNLPIPSTFRKNLELVLNSDLRRLFENGNLKIISLKNTTDEILKWKVDIDKMDVAFAAENNLHKMVKDFTTTPDITLLEKIHTVLDSLYSLNITLNLWQVQNVLFTWATSNTKDFKRIQTDSTLEIEFYRLAERMELSL